jgi:hypothetical protein
MADHMPHDGSNGAQTGRHFRGEGQASRHVRPKAVRSTSGLHSAPQEPQRPAPEPVAPVPVQPVYNESPNMPQDWNPYTASSYYSDDKRRHHHHHHHHKSHKGLVIALCIIVALVGCVGVAGYSFYKSAKAVAADASAMVGEAQSFSQKLASGDTSTLSESATKISALTSEMSDETSGTLWDVAENIPAIGSDISKVRTLVSVSRDLSTKVVTPAAESLNGVSMGTIFSGGKIDVEALTSLCNTVAQVQPEIESAASRVDALGTASMDEIDGPLQKVKTTLDTLNAATKGLSEITPTLPAMLGADGARTYLVVAQNNSEIRSTGGFPGSRMTLTIDNGQIEMGDFEAVGDHFANGTIPLTDEESTVVTDIMQTGASFAPGDVNAVPSFPRAAQLMEWCWEKRGYGNVDGVIAIDPVFLQSLLQLVGGVTTSDGTVVDGTNAAEILLNKTYYLPTSEQDPFFSEVAGLALDKVMDSLGSVSMTDLAKTLGDGVEQGRFLVYMDNADEEATITTLGADGEVNTDPASPVTGFYIYDKTGSKLDWYLDMRSQVSAPTVNSDGSKSYTVTVTLGNTTTLEQMEDGLPGYITGVTPEVHHYSMITAFLAMAPAGGTITNFQVNADEVNAQQEASLYGNDVWAGYVNIYPSSTATFTYTVTTAPNPASDLTVWTTPTGRSFA